MNNSDSPLDRIALAVESWVQTPRFGDPALQRKAEVIHILSAVVILIALATISITPFVFTNITTGVSLTAGILLFSILVQILNKLGKTNLAASLFVIGIWLFNTGVIFFSGGFQSSYLVSYITITVMGGLILGEMTAFQLAGVSTTALLIFYFLEYQSLLPAPVFVFTPIARIIVNIVTIFLAAIILVLMLTRYEENVTELLEKEETLSNINQKMAWEIGARQEAEVLLRHSEDRLKSALMNSPYPTMLHAENGEILLLNKAWAEHSGYTLEDLNSLEDWLEHFYRDSRDQVAEHFRQLVSGGKTHQDGYLNLYQKSGQPLSWYLRWTRLPDLPDGRSLILTIATDLTTLQSVESALRESEENLSKFTLVTNDGLWDWDLTTDEVKFDPRYYTMAGYEVNEFPHQLEEFRSRVHPDDVGYVFNQAEAHLKGEIDRFNVEFRFRQKDGSWLWVMGRGKITEQDEYGNPLRFVGTHTDISAQKEIEEQLHQHQLQLEKTVEQRTKSLNERISEVERLNSALTNILDDYQIANEKLSALSSNLSSTYEELESVTYSMSTDLQKPVLSIKNSADQLVSQPTENLTTTNLDTLQEIRENAALVDQRIKDLLSISLLNRRELSVERVDVQAVVQEVVKSFQKEIDLCQLKMTIQDLPDCQADPELLQQVFSNLIGNAIKFTCQEKTPQITIGSQPGEAADRVIYYVQDNGIGFEMKDQEIVFQTFQQLHDQEQLRGAGVGLTTAKIIVNKHGGDIWAEAERGVGATFYFELRLSTG